MNKVANVILIQAVFVKKCFHFSWVNNKDTAGMWGFPHGASGKEPVCQ